jgi:hypothetical protein
MLKIFIMLLSDVLLYFQLYPDMKTFKMKLYALKLLVIGARKERMSTSTLHLHEYLLPDQFSKLVTKYKHS